MSDYVILEAIKTTGYSEWLVCEVQHGETLKVTNTCLTKEDAVRFAQVHAIEEQKQYNIRLMR